METQGEFEQVLDHNAFKILSHERQMHIKSTSRTDERTAAVITENFLCLFQGSYSQYANTEHSFNILSTVGLYSIRFQEINDFIFPLSGVTQKWM